MYVTGQVQTAVVGVEGKVFGQKKARASKKAAQCHGAWPYNRPCAQQYVGKSQSCMVISGRLIVHAPVGAGLLTFTAPAGVLVQTSAQTARGVPAGGETAEVWARISTFLDSGWQATWGGGGGGGGGGGWRLHAQRDRRLDATLMRVTLSPPSPSQPSTATGAAGAPDDDSTGAFPYNP